MATRVHAATIHDSVGAVDTIKLLRYDFPRLRKIIADIVKCLGWELSVVLRSGESSKIMTESKLICFEFTGYQLIQEEGADFARQLKINYLLLLRHLLAFWAPIFTGLGTKKRPWAGKQPLLFS